MAEVVTGTFTGTGASSSIRVGQRTGNGEFNIHLSGTWVGTVDLQRSFDNGTTWVDVADESYTANTDRVGDEPENGVLYRLNCSAYTSGTVTYRLGANYRV